MTPALCFHYLCGHFWEACGFVALIKSTWLHKLLLFKDISIKRSETIYLMEFVMPEVILYFIEALVERPPPSSLTGI